MIAAVARGWALLFALALAIGETLVLWRTDKFWPLSLDDYLIVAILASAAFKPFTRTRGVVLCGAWCAAVGNSYAMLFGRLDPVWGSGQRIGLLILLLSAALLGLALSTVALRNWSIRQRVTAIHNETDLSREAIRG